MVEYARVTRDMALPIDRVWSMVRHFGGIGLWVAGVSSCVLDGPEAVGVVRLVSLGDRQVREQLQSIDHAARRLTYDILTPHSLPAGNVRSTIAVDPVGATAVRVTWFSEAEMDAPNPDLTRRIEGFFAASLAGLERVCAAT